MFSAVTTAIEGQKRWPISQSCSTQTRPTPKGGRSQGADDPTNLGQIRHKRSRNCSRKVGLESSAVASLYPLPPPKIQEVSEWKSRERQRKRRRTHHLEYRSNVTWLGPRLFGGGNNMAADIRLLSSITFAILLACQFVDSSTEHSGHTLSDTGCPDGTKCSVLGSQCIKCNLSYDCVYGADVKVQCRPLKGVNCTASVLVVRD